jgi:hypothetical protein
LLVKPATILDPMVRAAFLAGFFVTCATLRSDTSPIAGGSAELFNTAEEKFVEKRELTLVTFC